MARKTYHVAAMQGRQMLCDLTLDTRAGQRLALREALGWLKPGGVVMTKTENAATWGVYRMDDNGKSASLLHSRDAAAYIATLEHFRATGGTYAETEA